MEYDDRFGCSFKPCDDDLGAKVLGNVEDFEIGEVSWDLNNDHNLQTLTWSRKDYGTSRLMMPGCNGPHWSSCTRRVTTDLDTNQIIADRPAREVTRKEGRREFKGGGRNTMTTLTYQVAYDTKPHQWQCSSC